MPGSRTGMATCFLQLAVTSGCGRRSPVSRYSAAADSAAAVRAATAALSRVPELGSGKYRLVSFLRDSAGFLVGLQRTDAVLGGGGLVRVARDGSVTSVKLWQ